MASNWSLCAVCDNRQITKPSVVWCSDCDEGLCGDCKEHHSISKGTKHHITVSLAEDKNLSPDVLQIAQICKIHNKKYELFCKKHDCPCCKKCAKVHNNCKGLTEINELIKNVKTSNAFYEIEQTLLEIFENIKRISSNRENNYAYLKNKKSEVEAEIKQARTKINRHLDKLQDNLMKDLMATEQKESSHLQNLLTSLKKKEKQIEKYQANFAETKLHASELQTFLSIKQIEKEAAVEEKFIESLIKSKTTNQVNISCLINKSLQEITTTVKRFGEISISSDPYELSIQKRKDRQAQIMVALPTRNINNMTMTLQKRINTELSNIRGCSMLPDGRMVFSCYAKQMMRVLKSDGSKDFEIKEIHDTFDVVFNGINYIAVTSSESDLIYIINLKKKKLKKSIKVTEGNYGVANKDGKLIYCAVEKGILMINLSDESITNVTENKLATFAYVATFGDKLFYTNDDNHSVTCCDYHGNILWTFCDTSVLMCPVGISVDNDGNVFVVGYRTHNVVVISPDGQRSRQLLSNTDGLNNPTVLHYDTSNNKLLVTNKNDHAFVYDVK